MEKKRIKKNSLPSVSDLFVLMTLLISSLRRPGVSKTCHGNDSNSVNISLHFGILTRTGLYEISAETKRC